MSEIISDKTEANAGGRAGMQKRFMALAPVIEEAFIRVIEERVTARRVQHKKFVQAVWPDVPVATALGRWRDMRKNAYNTNKRMTVSLESAFRMAAFFNEDICYLIVLAQEYALNHNLTDLPENDHSDDLVR